MPNTAERVRKAAFPKRGNRMVRPLFAQLKARVRRAPFVPAVLCRGLKEGYRIHITHGSGFTEVTRDGHQRYIVK